MATSDPGQANRLVGLAIGALAPIVVSLILVPFRHELDNANLALILVLVVVVAALLGGRGAGALAAVMATLSFDFFLDPPVPLDGHRVAATTSRRSLILLGVGLLVGEMASRGRRSQRGRERAAEAIARVHRVADEIAQGASVDDVVGRVTRELRALLSLHDCWLEFRPYVYVMPRLERGGTISQAEHHYFEGGHRALRGRHRAAGARAGGAGRPPRPDRDPEVAVTIEERVVAVALADQLGTALALAGPAERERLAKESRQE